MSRNDKSKGEKFSGRQGGGKSKKSSVRENAPIKPESARKLHLNLMEFV